MLPICNFQLLSKQEQMSQTLTKLWRHKDAMSHHISLISQLVFWQKPSKQKNVLNKKQKTSTRYKRTLGVYLLNHHIPSTLCLDSCFSDSALDVTAEAEDVSVVTEVICRHETTDFKIFTNRMINATAQKQSATDFRATKSETRSKTKQCHDQELSLQQGTTATQWQMATNTATWMNILYSKLTIKLISSSALLGSSVCKFTATGAIDCFTVAMKHWRLLPTATNLIVSLHESCTIKFTLILHTAEMNLFHH